MCWQKFQNFACGHSDLREDTCELAEDDPFYLKVACPNYAIDTAKISQPCGIGRFYCRETLEGHFFDSVCQLYHQLDHELRHAVERRSRLNAKMANFMAQANNHGLSMEHRKRHSAYTEMVNAFQQLQAYGLEITDQHKLAKDIIALGIAFCRRRAQNVGNGAGDDLPPFSLPTNVASKLPNDCQVRLAALPGEEIGVDHIATSDTINVSYNPRGYEKPARHDTATNGLAYPYEDSAPPALYTAKRNPQYIGPSGGQFGGLLPARRPNNPSKRSIEQTSIPGMQSPPVRRSARVRDKKVSYAESDVSDLASSEGSPGKSDEDRFSPPKSDMDDVSPPNSEVSVSPERKVRPRSNTAAPRRGMFGPTRRPGNSNSNMSSLIGEWSKRAGGTSSVAAHDQRVTSGVHGNRFDPTMHPDRDSLDVKAAQPSHGPSLAELLARHQSAMQRGETQQPTAAYEPENTFRGYSHNGIASHHATASTRMAVSAPRPVSVPNYQLNLPINQATVRVEPIYHYQGGQSQAPDMTGTQQGWHLNMPAYNILTRLAMDQEQTGSTQYTSEAMQRHDSALELHGNRAAGTRPEVGADYDRMRRSFIATADLTPPSTTNSASVNTDPKKRSLPASSPLPSKKRVRLSFPGDSPMGSDHNEPSRRNVRSASSPMKPTDRRNDGSGQEDATVSPEPDDTMGSTPAPILAPTAPMYMVPAPDALSNTESDVKFSDVFDDLNNGGTIANGAYHPGSDIDWCLFNDDLF